MSKLYNIKYLLRRKVSLQQLKDIAEENNISYYEEVSAKQGINIIKIFLKSAKMLYDDYVKYQKDNEIFSKNSFVTLNNFQVKSDSESTESIKIKKQIESDKKCCI